MVNPLRGCTGLRQRGHQQPHSTAPTGQQRHQLALNWEGSQLLGSTWLGFPGSLGPGGGASFQRAAQEPMQHTLPATWWREKEGAPDNPQTGSALPPGGKPGAHGISPSR